MKALEGVGRVAAALLLVYNPTALRASASLQPPAAALPTASAALPRAALGGHLAQSGRPPLTATVALAASAPAAISAASSPLADEVWALLDKYYLDRSFNGIDWQAEHKTILESRYTESEATAEAQKLVSALGDRYSRIIPAAKAGRLNKYDVTGIGLNLVISDSGEMLVGAVPPDDSAAARAKIRYGDKVLEINGQTTEGMTSFDALEAIQRDPAIATLRVQPKPGGASTEARAVTLQRTFTQARDPVKYRIVARADGVRVGYIKLSEFNAQCKARTIEALSDLERQGATRLVLDLRGNGGGVLDGAISIAGLFAERPLVLYVTDANGSRQPLYSREASVETLAPMEVWVDASTASSAEVLAAALHDNCRASLVGSKTYGKGVIQGVFGLSDGSSLIQTVASYATPSGAEINRKGVEVDKQQIFYSDVLGSSWVDQDVRSASITPVADRGVCSVPREVDPDLD